MTLNLVEQLTLLALDDEKGTFLTDALYFGHAIGGTILMQLVSDNLIQIENKKLIPISETKLDDLIFGPYLSAIQESKKPRSLEHWMSYFSSHASKTTNACVETLMAKGLLEKQESKLLWVFTQKKYPAVDSSLENDLKKRLLKIAESRQKPNEDDLLLIQLIEICELGKTVYGKENNKRYKTLLKNLVKENKLSNDISNQIQATQAAIIASITAANTAALVVIMINS